MAHDTGALKRDDLARVTIDATVQPKKVMHPTHAKLMLKAVEQLALLAKRNGVSLHQSYARGQAPRTKALYPRPPVQTGSTASLGSCATRLDRLIRDISGKSRADERLRASSVWP